MTNDRQAGPGAPDAEEKSYLSAATWTRGLFMVIFGIVWVIAEAVLLAVAIFQFGFVLFTREPNAHLTAFGQQLATYLYEIARFVTFNSEDKPWPFTPWPRADARVPARSKKA